MFHSFDYWEADLRVLVIGGGGREHALVWKLSRNPYVEKMYAIPGNAGIARLADCVSLDINDNQTLVDFALQKKIDLTVVGPEAPLVNGIVDVFEAKGLPIFGPRQDAALLEGSKSFAKQIMYKYGVPTAEATTFTDFQAALDQLEKSEFPLVIKADGLAAGKGVTVCFKQKEAVETLKDCFVHRKFGSAGDKVAIEEYLTGEEVSVLVFSDGQTILPLVPAQDYKRIFDGDTGPNTGGMGSYSPVPALSCQVYYEIVDRIFRPVIEGMAKEGIEYRGVLYGGLILTEDGPKVLEFNCRFGDPETQAILPLFEGDLLEVMLAVTERNLADYHLNWSDNKCVSVVLASEGYPGNYQTGFEIHGLKEVSAIKDVTVFHAGTSLSDGKVVTAGGRVLNVSALGETFTSAREKAYEAIDRITFEGKYYRKDIALKATEY